MRRAVLASGDGINFRDSDGNNLTAIGNVTYKAGDVVWTDGRCIYGWIRPNQPNELSFPSYGDVPWLDVENADTPTAANVLPLNAPRNMKRLCRLGAWVQSDAFFVAGEKRCYLVHPSTRQAVDLVSGEDFTLATPERASSASATFFDGLVDNRGNLLLLEVYDDVSGDYVGFAVHGNDSIISTVEYIEGETHAAYGETVYTRPMALHLRPDGSFCGTLQEVVPMSSPTGLLDDSHEAELTALGTPLNGYVRHSYDGSTIYTGDLTQFFYTYYNGACTYRYQPFKDCVCLNVHEHKTASGCLFYYDSANGGTKAEIYRQLYDVEGDGQEGGLVIDGEPLTNYEYEDPGEYISGWKPDVNYPMEITGGQPLGSKLPDLAISFEVYKWANASHTYYDFWLRAYVDGVRNGNETMPGSNFHGLYTETRTQTGSAYSYALDDVSVSCAEPSKTVLDGLGAVQPARMLPTGFTGGASVAGFSFQQSEKQVFDAVSSPKGGLALANDGLYLSGSLIHRGFAGYSNHYVNSRICEAQHISQVRDTLERDTL